MEPGLYWLPITGYFADKALDPLSQELRSSLLQLNELVGPLEVLDFHLHLIRELGCNKVLVLLLWCYELSARSRRLATAVTHLLYNLNVIIQMSVTKKKLGTR